MDQHQDDRENILKTLKIPEDTITFLKGIKNSFVQEWIYLCVVENMPLNKIKEIMEKIEKSHGSASTIIMTERMNFLRNVYRDNKEIEQKVDDLHDKVVNVYDLTSSLMKNIDEAFHNILKEKDQIVEEKMEHHMDRINEKDQMIENLRRELLESKQERHQQEEYFKSTSEQLQALHKELQITSQEMRDGQKTNQKNSLGAGTSGKEKKTFKKKWKEIFRKSSDQEAQIFIKTVIERDGYTDEQKDYLVSCLEDGDSPDLIAKFASPNLSIDFMRRIRSVAKRDE
ncbi:MAG: hypothetical protein U0K57_03250 [Lachnospiraceae bacterium]|nr:hypothetical protein [Lachnospiraceae bacterium]